MQPLADSSTFVASLAKGLEILRCFGPEAERMTLSEVAARTGYSRATARRFLLTLTTLGYTATDGKYFELTPKVLTLGHAYLSSLSFWEASRHYLEDVTRQTEESCSMAVLDGDDVVYVARSDSRRRLMSVALYVGARLPVHATSMGQVLLAAMSDTELAAYLSRSNLPRYTAKTLCTSSELRARLRVVQKHGFALVDQELERGLRSIAVPVVDRQHHTVAAVNISANAARISRSHMVKSYLPHLRTAARLIQDTF